MDDIHKWIDVPIHLRDSRYNEIFLRVLISEQKENIV